MQNNFKIFKYQKEDDKFIKTGYDEYVITYLIGKKPTTLRVVVNGYLTKQVIHIMNHRNGFKKNLLLAVKEYLANHETCKAIKVVKKVNIETIKQQYSKQIYTIINNYLLPINKEDSRDILTEYKLI